MVTPLRRLLRNRLQVELVRELASSAGWRLEREYEADADTGEPLELVWVIPGVSGDVHYIRDDYVEIDYFFRGTGDLDAIHAEIEHVFEIVSDTEIAAGIDDPDGRTRAWAALALALSSARVASAVLSELFTACLADHDPLVRRSAAIGLGYLNDRRWIEPLEELATGDPDPQVVAEALRTARGLAMHAPQED